MKNQISESNRWTVRWRTPFLATLGGVAVLGISCAPSQMVGRPGEAPASPLVRQGTPTSSASPTLATPHIRGGLAALRKRNYPAAVQTFSRALKLDPTNPHLHFLNGLSYDLWAKSGDRSRIAQAVVGYRLALRFDPSNYWAAYQLGCIEFESQRYQQAQDRFSEALLIKNDDAEVIHALAIASYYARDLETAISAIQAAHRANTQDGLPLRSAALIYAAAGDDAAADDFFQRYARKVGPAALQNDPIGGRLQDFRALHARLAAAGPEAPSAAKPPPPPDPEETPSGLRKMPKMVQIDVVLIRSEDRLTTRKGVNLLDGLKLAFSSSPVDYAWDFTKTPSLISNKRSVKLDTQEIIYSLNIFNDTDSRNEILAQPSLVAVENQTSDFFSGAKLWVELSGAAGQAGAMEQVDVGVKLSVTPVFLDDQTVQIQALIERDSIEPSQAPAASFDEFVQTSATKLTAHAILQFDETLILSGLNERETSSTRSGVPFLQNVPGVQYGFSRHDALEFNTSVLVLLTPRRISLGKPSDDLPTGKDPAPAGSENLREVKKLPGWLQREPNLDRIFAWLKDSRVAKEFRHGDVQLPSWDVPDKLGIRLKRALQFLYY